MLKRVSILLVICVGLSSLCGSYYESLEFGKKMYRDGFYTEASLEFEKIVQLAPNSLEAEESIFLLAEMNREQGNYADAEAYYRDLYEKYQRSSFREKALYYWGITVYKQQKFGAATNIFTNFIETYPTSTDRGEAFYYLVDSYLGSAAYHTAIEKGKLYLDVFANGIRKPDVLVILAQAYLKSDKRNDADNFIDLVINNYPTSNARWKATIIKGELLEEEKGSKQALHYFLSQLSNDIPRQYEEALRKKIAVLQISENRLIEAAEQFTILIEKFDRSENLAEYVYLYTKLLLQLNKNQDMISFADSFGELDLEDEFAISYLLNIGEAYYNLSKFDKIREILTKIDREVSEENRYRINYWQARLKESSQEYLVAIEIYQELANLNAPYANKLDVLMRIGDIYFEGLKTYQTAIKYFDQVVVSVSSKSDYYWRALYKMALCYEAMEQYQTALNTLRQINPETIQNGFEREEYYRVTNLLNTFKVTSSEKAVSEVINSFYGFLVDNDKEKLKEQLLTTLLYEMNDYETTLKVLTNDSSDTAYYLRGRAYLRALYKANLEKNEQGKQSLVKNIETSINHLINKRKDKEALELTIEKEYLTNNQVMTDELLAKTDDFVGRYADSTMTDIFNYYIGSHYLDNNFYLKADQYFSKINSFSNLPSVQYERALVKMSEYLFDNGRYKQVIEYLNKISDRITLSEPDVLYRYAISLIESGETSIGYTKLELLVKNTRDFKGFQKSLEFITAHYRRLGKYDEVIYFMDKYPADQRGEAYYQELSDDYLKKGDELKAKESLMYIDDKGSDILAKLADLHYRTDDIAMAEYTYKELLKVEKDSKKRAVAQSQLAHIYHNNEEWKNSSDTYDSVIQHLDDKLNPNQYDYLNLIQIGKEATINLYRLNNRPKAETLQKRFQNVLKESPDALAEIDLNKAVYQMSVNRNQAEKGFNELIKKQGVSEEIKYQAYFWRGLNYLEVKRTDDAYKDFEMALRASSKAVKNQASLKLGTINFSKERYQLALDHYLFVIQNDGRGSLAYDAAKNYAIVCKTIEEWKKAIEAYEIILERWGEGEIEGETLFNIAFCHYRDRNYTEAIKTFEQSLVHIGDREIKAEAQHWIGGSYFNLNQFDSAITEYRKVGYFYPDFVEWVAVSELKIAEAYMKQEKMDSAKDTLNRIISKYGRASDWGKQAQLLLQQF